MPLDAGYLAMLTTSATWEHKQSSTDQWGNEQYSSPETIKCFVTSQNTVLGRAEQGQVEGEEVTTMSVITDALGITPKDRLVISGKSVYVVDVDTPKDEVGVDLMHTLNVTTAKKG